jgi:hypothetical protein
MRNHWIVITGVMLAAPFSKAASPHPAQTVEMLLHTNHGINELAGKEVRETWEEVRRDPKPYLPHLKARLTLERIEAAEDREQFRGIRNAISFLFKLGGSEARGFLMTRLKELHAKRDALTAQVHARVSRPGATHSLLHEDASFVALLERRGRFSRVEQDILSGFAEAGDPSLRDTLLPRLKSDEDMLGYYVEYFKATGRNDSLVRAHLKKMLETPGSLSSREYLRSFFE